MMQFPSVGNMIKTLNGLIDKGEIKPDDLVIDASMDEDRRLYLRIRIYKNDYDLGVYICTPNKEENQ